VEDIDYRLNHRLYLQSKSLDSTRVVDGSRRLRSLRAREPLLDEHDRSIAPLPPVAAFQSRSPSWIARFRRNDVTDLQHARATRAPGVTQGVRSPYPEISVRTVKTLNVQQRPGRSKIGQSAGQTTPRGELAVRWRAASGDPTRLRIGCNHVRACVYPVFPLLGIREGISFARCRSPLHQREQYSSLPTPRVVQISVRGTEPLSGIPMNSMNNRDRSSGDAFPRVPRDTRHALERPCLRFDFPRDAVASSFGSSLFLFENQDDRHPSTIGRKLAVAVPRLEMMSHAHRHKRYCYNRAQTCTDPCNRHGCDIIAIIVSRYKSIDNYLDLPPSIRQVPNILPFIKNTRGRNAGSAIFSHGEHGDNNKN